MSPRSLISKSRLGFSSFSSPRSQRSSKQVLSKIPRIIRDSIDFLRENDRDKTEGLFRIPGDSDHVNKLIMLYDSVENTERDEDEDDEDENLLEKYSTETSAHDVATLMKRYLMKLSFPLIDETTKKEMINIYARGKNDGKDKQLIAYEVILKALDISEENRLCLAFVLRFLLMVSNSSNVTVQTGTTAEGESNGNTSNPSGNKMTVENLARVFAPIIMRDDEMLSGTASNNSVTSTTPKDQMKQIDQIIAVTEILIWNALELVGSSSSSSSAAALQSGGSFSSKSERF